MCVWLGAWGFSIGEIRPSLTRADPPLLPLRIHVPAQDMRRSVFCLHPTGGGWGLRLIEAVQNGCIPLIVQACGATMHK